jgi:hypothetical protein
MVPQSQSAIDSAVAGYEDMIDKLHGSMLQNRSNFYCRELWMLDSVKLINKA